MTDRQTPTDAEIVALADETRTAEGGANGYILPISFARAVLARWGAQPAGEPVGFAHAGQLDNIADGYAYLYPKAGPGASVPLYKTAQPAPVREPLTDPELVECIEAAGFKTWDNRMWSLKREIEQRHGITATEPTKCAPPR